MNFALNEDGEALRQAAQRFAERELAPGVRAAESRGCWSDEVLRVVDGFGLAGLDVPAERGGAGLGSLAKAVLLETLAHGDAGGLLAADPLGLAAGALVACPDVATAKTLAAACLGREGACALVVAADPGRAPTRIEWTPARTRWAWITDGDDLRLLELSAAVAAAPALAFHASGGGSIGLDGARTLGAWQLDAGLGMQLRGRARLWAAAVATGVAQAALDATVAYATERIVFGKPVAHHQGNAFELAVAATRLQAARLMVRYAAAGFDDADSNAGFWASQAWLETMATAVTVTDLGVQLLGGHGFLKDHLAEKRFREARMLGLLAGGRDAADADVAAGALDPDPLFDMEAPA